MPKTVDFIEIKKEYIAGGISLEKLAEKYKISASSIKRRASNEGWKDLRTKAEQKANEKIVNSTGAKQGKNKAKIKDEITTLCEALLKKINDNIEDFTKSPKDVKAISDVLKNINDIVGEKQKFDIDKTKQDIKEQKLKIKRLEKEMATESTDKVIQVEILGGESFAQ